MEVGTILGLYWVPEFFLAVVVRPVNFFLDWLSRDDRSELFGEMVCKKPYIESTREFLGLLIAIGSLLYLLKSKKIKTGVEGGLMRSLL
jgi:hypothetical protein